MKTNGNDRELKVLRAIESMRNHDGTIPQLYIDALTRMYCESGGLITREMEKVAFHYLKS